MKLPTRLQETGHYVEHESHIGLVSHGETIESCFEKMASIFVSLMTNVNDIHQIQIITFEFSEEHFDRALVTWLNLLFTKSKEHHLMLGDFHIKHEAGIWKATVAGEPCKEGFLWNEDIKRVIPNLATVIKDNHIWEARCTVDIS